ncbi:MAG: type I phosphomannose isomerase catalytic subunit [Phycisphaerales bacterium]
MPLPPLRFRPILKSRAWGGRRLARFGKSVPPAPAPPVGESWEIADLAPPVDDGVSRVAGGPFDGASLRDLLGSHRKAILGAARDVSGHFPLLVKFLDAAEHLSVQVHPTAGYAAHHPGAHLKTEAWVVLEAEPGARIFRGVRADVTADRFRTAIADGTAVDLLVAEEVRAGDCIPLVSGLCHALGAGVVVAEVQTPSDTTFRVYDWNRNDPARPLHVAQALECILFGEAQGLDRAPVTSVERLGAMWSDGLRSAMLCANEHFEIEGIESSPSGDAAPIDFVAAERPEVLMLLSGEAVLEAAGHRAEHLRAGDTVMLPADRVPTTVDLSPQALLLRATTADPMGSQHDGPRAGERRS